MNIYIRTVISSFILFLIFVFPVIAQKYHPYQWKENRSLTNLSDEEKSFGLYYIQIREQYQYLYDPNDNQFICYVTNHNIIRVNNDEALSKSNRVYIPMKNTIELTDIKARSITRDNSVINLNKSNIKELESEESGYKIFAIEGAEVGGEIEYYYTLKVNTSNFITRIFQYSYPVKSYNFSLKCPENLEYDFKIYNSNGDVEQTDTTDSYNLYEFNATDIPPLYSEDFSGYENSKARLEFKLAYNTKGSKSRLFTWGSAGQRIYDIVNATTKDEQKAFNKFVKELDLGGDPIDAFKRFEHEIKTNFFIQEDAGTAGSQLNEIIKNKYATSEGFTRLYAAMLNHLNIQHEIVLTSDRTKHEFDPNFDTWNYLDEYLIYITKTDQFISPKDIPFRCGTIPMEYLESNAIFVRTEPIQDFTYPVAHIAKIPRRPYTDNFDNMDIEVSFSDELDKNSVNLTRSYLGYSADYYKAALLAIEEEDKKKMLDEIVKYLALDAEILDLTISEANTTYDSWNKPFTIKSKFNSNMYIESAGDIILFKAGELIGPQSEMYQERDRTMQIVNDFNRGYLRKIKVNIPDGYTIQNPEDLVIKEQVFNDDTLIYNFLSSYTIEGQFLEIEIDEFYDKLYFPVEKFEAFRKVINTAADWNKIVLVLQQQ